MFSLWLVRRVLSALHASILSAVGLYIMWETREDCLYSRYDNIAANL